MKKVDSNKLNQFLEKNRLSNTGLMFEVVKTYDIKKFIEGCDDISVAVEGEVNPLDFATFVIGDDSMMPIIPKAKKLICSEIDKKWFLKNCSDYLHVLVTNSGYKYIGYCVIGTHKIKVVRTNADHFYLGFDEFSNVFRVNSVIS